MGRARRTFCAGTATRVAALRASIGARRVSARHTSGPSRTQLQASAWEASASAARWDNYVEIDPNVVDTFGIPVLRFHMTYGENEFAMLKDMADSAAEMLEAAGAKNVSAHAHANAPGWAIHEVGIARMGDDPKASVLNQFEQSHDIKNLFVMDGSAFPSTACQNPTLTIMALAVRSCDYLMQEMKKGNI